MAGALSSSLFPRCVSCFLNFASAICLLCFARNLWASVTSCVDSGSKDCNNSPTLSSLSSPPRLSDEFRTVVEDESSFKGTEFEEKFDVDEDEEEA